MEENEKRRPEVRKRQKSLEAKNKRNPKTVGKLKSGDIVLLCNGNKAVVRFIGSVQKKKGEYYGLELLDAQGNHDGSFQGKRYFKCPRKRGMFVRRDKIEKKLEPESKRRKYERQALDVKKTTTKLKSRRRPSAVLHQKVAEQLNSESDPKGPKPKKKSRHNRSVSLLSQVNANAKRVKRKRTRSRNFSQTLVDLPGRFQLFPGEGKIMVGINRKRKVPVNKETLDTLFQEAQRLQNREKGKSPPDKKGMPAIELQIFQKYCAENGFNLGVNQFLLDLHSQSLELEEGVNMSDFRAILSYYYSKKELEGPLVELFRLRPGAPPSPLSAPRKERAISYPLLPEREALAVNLEPLKEVNFVKPPKTPPGELADPEGSLTPPASGAGEPVSPRISEADKKKHAIRVGDKVSLIDCEGRIRYIGSVLFAKSVWFGIEVPPDFGNHDGMVDGKRYFQCSEKCGIFVKKKNIIKKILPNGVELSARQLPVITGRNSSKLLVHKRSKSKNQPEIEEEDDPDLEAIDLVLSYILDEEKLGKLFTFFDRKSRGVLSGADIYYLVYIGILVFSKAKSGKKFAKPKMSSISKLVKKMTKHLVKKVFDGKTVLNLEDFGKYGDYLKREYEKLEKKLEEETSI